VPPLANAPSLTFALPEVILVLGILTVLLVGLVRRDVSRYVPAALTMVVAAAALLVTVTTGDHLPRGLFEGLIARDPFADFFKGIALCTVLVVALVSTRARDAIDYRRRDREAPELYALLLSAVLGVHLMAAATDLLMVYLSLEFVSVMSYVLTGFTRGSRRSAEAALKYVIYGGVASGTFLYGLSLLYGLAGATDLPAVRAALAEAPPLLAFAAVALCMAGFGYKVAVVPFHMWCPDVYQGAPTVVAAFLSVAPKAGGFALILRFFHAPGGPDVTSAAAPGAAETVWPMLALTLAVVTMTLGNLAALAQRNLKRLLAYSAIAHAGYLFLGVAVGPPAGHQAILFYLGVYLFMNLAAFCTVVAVADRGGGETVESWAGLGTRMPLAAFVMTVALFALAGIPPTAGFIGKYYLFAAVVQEGRATGAGPFYVAAVIAVLNSVVSLSYYARVVRAMYIEKTAPGAPALGPLPLPHAVALIFLLAPTILLGLYWAPLESLSGEALRLWTPPGAEAH
jgi:NADH-quinone oxidoreductase subunit N